jgi:hypothetical protein
MLGITNIGVVISHFIQLLKTSFVGGRLLELSILSMQLSHGLGDLRESFDELLILSY